jgi:hypothetical protein
MKRLSVLGSLFGIILVLTLTSALMTSLAQDVTSVEDDPSFTIVTGALEFTPTGDIVVAGIIIAPAGAFNPSDLEAGDLVIVTGLMLNDGTLQAISLELFDDTDDEVEVTPEPELTPEATLEVTPEVTPELTPEATTAPEADCGNPNHPVATRIAETFDVTYEEVMAMHCAGEGFGNIIRAYTLAAASTDGATAQDFIDRHHNGEGWGHIMADSDVHPSDLAPGQVIKHHDEDVDDSEGGGNGGGNGNGNNGGNGNGGNGGGHGNGGGNGNGNGNGNNGGNGNGNGGNGNGGGHGGKP